VLSHRANAGVENTVPKQRKKKLRSPLQDCID
jgi:hypothetical protein